MSSASTSSSSRLLPLHLHLHLLLLPLASLLLLIVHHHWVSLQWVRERFLETRELSPVSEREVSLDTSNHTKCTQPLIHLQPERNHRQWQKWSLLLLLLGSYKINLKLMMIDDDYFKWWWWKTKVYTLYTIVNWRPWIATIPQNLIVSPKEVSNSQSHSFYKQTTQSLFKSVYNLLFVWIPVLSQLLCIAMQLFFLFLSSYCWMQYPSFPDFTF